LRPIFERVAGTGVAFIDSGEAIARRAQALLGHATPSNGGGSRVGSITALTTGEHQAFAEAVHRLLGPAVAGRELQVASVGL
jgi:glutamate racemase